MATATSGISDLSKFISEIGPTLVNQRSTQTETPEIGKDAISMSDIAFAQAMSQATSSQEALVNNIFKRATLAFAPTLAGEHSAGVYDSTTQAQLQNEAMARATGEATDAVLKAQTEGAKTAAGLANQRVASERGTTTKGIKQPSLGSKAGTIATAVIAAQLAKKGVTKLGDLGNRLFSSDPEGALTGIDPASGVAFEPDAFAAGAGTGESAALDAAGVSATSEAIAEADALGAEGLGAGAAADALVTDAGEMGGFSALDAAAADEAATGASLGFLGEAGAGGAELGAEGTGLLESGGIIADIIGGAEEIIPEAATTWIVCTELHKQGRMPTRYYLPGAKVFLSYPEYGKEGYYMWAKPLTKHLQKYPYSILSNFACYIMNKRARQLAGRKSFAGFLSVHLLYFLCWLLSRSRTLLKKLLKGREYGL